MKDYRSRFLSSFLIVILLLATCACAANPKPQHPPLQVAYVLWPGYFPVIIAQEKGYFAEEGVEVELIFPQSSSDVRADLLAGNIDGLTFTLAGIVGASGEGDVHVIFATDESCGADAVVASADIQTIEDLKGKRIGVGFGGYGEIILSAMFENSELTMDDTTLLDVIGEDVPGEIVAGNIDAGVTWEPYVSQSVREGAHVLFDTEQTPGLIPDVMAFHGSTLRERPEDVRAFVRAWFRAVDYWLANPDEGAQLIAEAIDIEPEDASLEGIRLLTLEDNLAAFKRGDTSDSLYYTAQLYADFFVQDGVLGVAPDIDDLLQPSFLE